MCSCRSSLICAVTASVRAHHTEDLSWACGVPRTGPWPGPQGEEWFRGPHRRAWGWACTTCLGSSVSSWEPGQESERVRKTSQTLDCRRRGPKGRILCQEGSLSERVHMRHAWANPKKGCIGPSLTAQQLQLQTSTDGGTGLIPDRGTKILPVEQYRKKKKIGTSLVVQWLRICLAMQGMWLRFLVGEHTPRCN